VLNPELQVLLWSIFIFLVLMGLLWKFAWGPIMEALEKREHNIQHKIDEAEKKNAEALAKLAEYEKKLNAAKDEASAIIEQGKKDVTRIKEDILAEANKESAKTLERAKREIELAKESAVVELREKTIALTSQMATKILEREVKPDDHRRLINEALQQIETNKN
jgi:F-type H+-transporting ATPase subunit b